MTATLDSTTSKKNIVQQVGMTLGANNKTSYQFKFTGRDSYLEFRKDWKEAYHEMANESRNLKKDIVKAQKAGSHIEAAKLQSRLHFHSKDIHTMLEVRAASKIEAQRLWLAERAAK